jgi:hypothetical protein
VLSHCALFMKPSNRPADGPTARHAELLDRHGRSPAEALPSDRSAPARRPSRRADVGRACLPVLPPNLRRGAT